MKKRILTVLLAVCLMLVIAPAALASGNPVTEVGSGEDLSAALTAGGEIRLVSSFSASVEETVRITADTVLDLNGYTVTWATSANRAFEVSSGASLTIRSSGELGGLDITGTNAGIAPTGLYADGGSLNIEGGTISYTHNDKSSRVICISGSSSGFSLSGGTVIAAGQTNNGIYIINAAPCSVTGGTIEIRSSGSSNYGIYAYRSEVTVDDLTVDGSEVDDNYKVFCLYGYSSGGVIDVKGGTYTANDNEGSYAVNAGSSNPTSISGGTFNSAVKLTSGKISGGSFSVAPPAQNLEDGFIVQLNPDTDKYELAQGGYVARIGDTGYTDWDSAFAACHDSVTTQIYILSDVESITVPQNKDVRLSNQGGWSVGTIINNGTCEVYLYSMPETSIVNNGNFTLSREVFSIVNNSGATMTASGRNVVVNASVTNHGTMNLTEGKFLGTFSNDGNLTVTGGSFAQPDSIRSYVADGYDFYKVKDNAYGDLYAVYQPNQIQATVGDYYHIAWNTAALNASAEQPARLLVDLNLNPGGGSSLNINSGSDYYIDLNGHTMTVTGTQSYNYGFSISHGSLNLYNSQPETGGFVFNSYNGNGTGIAFSLAGSMQDNGPDYAVLRVAEGVKVTSDAYSIAMAGPINMPYGMAVYFDGILDTKHGPYINGQFKNMEGSVPVLNFLENSVITAETAGIYAAGYAEWNLAGDITGNGSEALSIKSGVFNITGGNYTANGEFHDPADANGNGSEVTGAALSITSNDGYPQKTVVNVTGGTFTSTNGYAVYEGIAKESDGGNAADASYAVLNIRGGSFTGASDKGAVNISTAENKNVISGGTFSSAVDSTYCAPGFAPVTNSDGTYGVSLDASQTFVAQILDGSGSVVAAYETLPDAISNADDGATVVVLQDTTLTDSLTIDKSITLKGANEEIVISGLADNDDIKVVVTGKNVTIQDLTFKDFGVNCKTQTDATVIEVPNTATDTTFLAKNLTIDGFCRNAFYFYAGDATVEDCTIICRNEYETTNTDDILVKGISAYGPSDDDPVTVLVKNTYIAGANSNYEEWDAGGIEIWEYADVTVENCTIESLGLGIALADGWTANQNSTVRVTGERTSITAPGGAVSVQNINNFAPSSSVYVEAGTFVGPVGLTYHNDSGAYQDEGFDACHDMQVSGGNFSERVDRDYLAGHLNAELYSPGSAPTPFSYFTSVDDALAAAQPGDEITYIGDGTVQNYELKVDYGFGDVITMNVPGGYEFALPELTRSGYTFNGWRSGGAFYRAGETLTVRGDTVLTAVWDLIEIPDTYEIELVTGEGGEASTSLTNASAGSTVTVSVTPDEGYELDYITVDGERISGTSFTMPGHDVTVRVYFKEIGAAMPFVDVAAGAWYYDAVSYVWSNGLMEGTSATTFEPDTGMTRAMVWAVLARMDGQSVSGVNWVTTARSWAMAEGVSDGTDPNSLITREQLATMLYRYAGSPAVTGNGISAFTDAASVSSWAVDAMNWALEQGIITGMGDGTLSPQGTATRAQAAAMLMRFVER